MRRRYLITVIASVIFLVFACIVAAIFKEVTLTEAGVATIVFVCIVTFVALRRRRKPLDIWKDLGDAEW